MTDSLATDKSNDPATDGPHIAGVPITEKHLLHVIWAALVFMIALFTMAMVLVLSMMFLEPATLKEIVGPFAQGKVISRTLVLFLVIPSITALTLLDKVPGSAALAALSAIAGYVLGVSNSLPS